MNLKNVITILTIVFLTSIMSCRETVKEDAHSDGHMENTEHMDDTDHTDLDDDHMKDEEHH